MRNSTVNSTNRHNSGWLTVTRSDSQRVQVSEYDGVGSKSRCVRSISDLVHLLLGTWMLWHCFVLAGLVWLQVATEVSAGNKRVLLQLTLNWQGWHRLRMSEPGISACPSLVSVAYERKATATRTTCGSLLQAPLAFPTELERLG